MVIPGQLFKEGSTYCASLNELLGAFATGRSRKAACEALAEMVLAIEQFRRPLDGFEVAVTHDGHSTLYLTSNDPARLVSMVLRVQRGWNQLSLAEVAAVMGAKSRNGYAVYEQGRSEPAVSKLQDLLDVVAWDFVLAIIPRQAAVDPRWPEKDYTEIDDLIHHPTPDKIAAFVASAPLAAAQTKARLSAARDKAFTAFRARAAARKKPVGVRAPNGKGAVRVRTANGKGAVHAKSPAQATTPRGRPSKRPVARKAG